MEFMIVGEPPAASPHLFTMSGLDNVWLLNGFTRSDDPEHGETIEFTDMKGLEQVVAFAICRREGMSGAELRYLRKHLGKSQEEMAHTLKVGITDEFERMQDVPAGIAAKVRRQVEAAWHRSLKKRQYLYTKWRTVMSKGD